MLLSLVCSFFSSWIPITWMLYLLKWFHSFWIFCCFIHSLLSLCLILGNFFWSLFKLNDHFLNVSSLLMSSFTAFFILVKVFLISIIFIRFLEFPWFYLHYLFVVACSLLFHLEPLNVNYDWFKFPAWRFLYL